MGVIRNQHRRNSSSNNESSDSMSINDLLDDVANRLEEQTLEDQDINNGQDEDEVIIIIPANGRRVGNRNVASRRTNDARMAEMIAEVEAKRAEKRFKKSNLCKFNPPRPEPTFRGLGCRGRSYRKHRRFENGTDDQLTRGRDEFSRIELSCRNMVAQSLAIAGLELDVSSGLDAISIDDFVPTTVSAFARLLMEKEHMKAWNDFIQCSEEEQEDFLRLIDSRSENEWVNGGNKSSVQSETGSKQLADNGKKSNERQNRAKVGGVASKHPAFCPDLSFARIDGNLKKFLRQRRIPMNLLERMEEEVSVFFETQPVNSIYRSCLPSGFQRLLLHATAQYLNLVCKSFDHGGSRHSHVCNKNDAFVRPTIKLSQYLESPRPSKFPRKRFGRRTGDIPANFAVDQLLG